MCVGKNNVQDHDFLVRRVCTVQVQVQVHVLEIYRIFSYFVDVGGATMPKTVVRACRRCNYENKTTEIIKE